MKIQEILDGKGKVLEFLRESGFEEEKDYIDNEYTQGTYFKIEETKLLVVYETSEKKLKETKDHFLVDCGLSYCLIVLDRKLLLFRNFGEMKYFVYSDRTKDIISKVDRLKQIETKGFDFIFQAGKDISSIFYETFKMKRDILAQHIKGDVEPVQKYLIAQKIFDRVFFIYFLCHKGIIKANNKEISGKNLFEILLREKEFFRALRDLFDKFNIPGNERTLELENYVLHVPYLNGGLFRLDVFEYKLKVTLKNSQWEGIFDFLNSFHWIIEDVKVLEEIDEKILTPEILGHVYERSVVEWESEGFEKEAENAAKNVTERKKKGVYYTPESITSYISNNTIIPYLLNKLENQYTSFDEMICSGNEENLKKALRILNEIKVLDPSCGSGAFLIQASEVLFRSKARILKQLGIRPKYYDLKLRIIVENIHGVDILEGAIEIAKLRLWLWLISEYGEEAEIRALPNIEFNLKVGNSLAGWAKEELKQKSILSPFTKEIDQLITQLLRHSDIEERKAFEKARDALQKYSLKEYIKSYYYFGQIYRVTHGPKADILKSILQRLLDSMDKSISPAYLEFVNSRLSYDYTKKSFKKQILNQADLDKLIPFHWRINFGNIMEEGGFDVVIGNPPYRNIETLPEKEKQLLQIYECYAGKSDVLYYFYVRGISLLKPNGLFGFITSRYFLEATYARNLRKYLLENMEISQIIDLSRLPVFKDVGIHTVVTIMAKRNNNYKPKNSVLYKEISTIEGILSTEGSPIDQTNFDEDGWLLGTKSDLDLFRRIDSKKQVCLGDISEIEQGQKTGLNSAYTVTPNIIRENKLERRFIRKLVKNSYIEPYYIKDKGLYLIYASDDVNSKTAPNIICYLHNFKKELIARAEARDGAYPWYRLQRPRSQKLFDVAEKIVVPYRAENNKFGYDNQQRYNDGGDVRIIVIQNLQYSTKYVLAILNSKLMNYYYRFIGRKKGTVYEYFVEPLEKIPIVKASIATQNQLVSCVEDILRLSQQKDNINGNETSYETEKLKLAIDKIQSRIDELVYDIYGLNADDRQIIETALATQE